MSRTKISNDFQDGYGLGYKNGYVDGAKDFQPKKGKWITHSDYPDRLICSNCNHKYDVWFIDNGTNFCPNCGCDMRGDV